MLFSAEIIDFRIIYNVLKAISFREFVVLRPMAQGLKLTLDEMKCVETSAYFPRNMFMSYRVKDDEDLVFKISLKVFTECLNIFGDDGNPSLKLSYKSSGSPLCLVITHNEENVMVDCEIRTMNADDFNEISLAEECSLNKVVLNADIFAEILQRLDNSADDIKVNLSSEPPYFTLITTGISGESEVHISKNSDFVTVFQCNDKFTSRYSFNNIRQILKVMNYASKVAVSTGDSGLLGLQLVMNSDDKQMYVEYYVTSLFGDNSDK